MNNLCPTCNSGYNLSAAHIGRQFACKKCGDTLLVTADGLRSSRAPSAPAAYAGEPATFDAVAAPHAGGFHRGTDRNAVLDFLTFRRLIVPIVIQVLFVLGVVGAFFFGIFTVVTAVRAESVLGVLWGLLIAIGGPFVARIYCELLIIFFRIYDTLGEIRDHLQRQAR